VTLQAPGPAHGGNQVAIRALHRRQRQALDARECGRAAIIVAVERQQRVEVRVQAFLGIHIAVAARDHHGRTELFLIEFWLAAGRNNLRHVPRAKQQRRDE
jgi:hypothetical protein